MITCPTVVSPVECPNTPVFGDATAVDACDDSPTITYEDVTTPGACPQEYSVTRTWTATDCVGNSSSCSKTIDVVDTTAPVITCPTVVTPVECPNTPVFGDATVVDACDDSPTITYEDVTTPGACPQEYSVTRTWTATDCVGNSSSCSKTIDVVDTTPPSITCPGDKTLECGESPGITLPTAGDACDNDVLVTASRSDGKTLNEPVEADDSPVTVTLTATDDCGNSATCTFMLYSVPCDHIFPTQTTCCHYRTESATQLYNICYTPSNKGGGSVGNAVPGVFFYYTYVEAPSSSFTIRVEQGNDGKLSKLFSVAQLDIKLFDENCDKLNTVEVSVDGIDNSVAHMKVSGANTGTVYVLGVKYDTKSIIGATYTKPAPISSYWFKTYVNNTYEVGSTGMIDAVPGCSDDTPLPGNCSLPQVASTFESTQTLTTLSMKSATTITAYPNPFSHELTFEFTANQDGKATIELFNMFGQKVATVLKQLVTEGEYVKTTYNPEGLVSGTYIYRFILGDTVLNGELIYQQQK